MSLSVTRNWEGQIESKLRRLRSEDARLLRRYDGEMKAVELSPATRAAQVHAVANLVDPQIPGSMEKPLADLQRDDLVSWLSASNLSPSSKDARLVVIRKFYKWLSGEKEPEVVQDLRMRGQKAKRKAKNSLHPKDLLSEEEVQAMIQLTPGPRNKALLALLWDSGARLGEVLPLRVGDVTTHPHYQDALRINFRESKTDARELALFDCRYWLTKWLAEHPLAGRDSAPLFPAQGSMKPLSEVSVRRIVKEGAERAKAQGLIPTDKRIFPHLYRHSRSTDLLSKGYSETKLKQRQGWDMNTRMIARYAHLSQKAAQEEDARLHGAVQEEEREESPFATRICSRCREENPPQARFCARCGMALAEDAARAVEDLEAKVSDELKRLVEEEIQRVLRKRRD